MNYVDHLNIFGVEAMQIPCIKGEGGPVGLSEVPVGCLYMDTTTGDMYKKIYYESAPIWVTLTAITARPKLHAYFQESTGSFGFAECDDAEKILSYMDTNIPEMLYFVVAYSASSGLGQMVLPLFTVEYNHVNKATQCIFRNDIFEIAVTEDGITGNVIIE